MPPRGGTTTGGTAIRPAKKTARPMTTEYVEALKAYAEVLYKGGLCPVFKKGPPPRPELVAAIIEIGRDVGLPPTQALANIQIVNGRPSIYGDAALALVRASGLLEDFEETFEGQGDDLTAVCRSKRAGAKRDKVERFSVADAKRAKLWDKEGPWQTSPRRMLTFRARGFNLRDEFTDVLCGLILYEEAIDIPADEPRQDVPVSVVTVPPPPPPAIPPATRGERMYHLAAVRESVFANRGIQTEAEQDAAWADILKPFGVERASQLDDAKLEELITDLEKQQDPSVGRSGT